MPRTKRHPPHPDHRLRADRHRPGLRVRLLGHAGVQGAARGRLRGGAGQLEPGHHHDRSRSWPTAPTSSRSRASTWRRSSSASGRTRCFRPWAGRRALNLAVELAEAGVLEQVRRGADRREASTPSRRPRTACCSRTPCGRSGSTRRSRSSSTTVQDGLAFAERIGYPCILRPSFTLGGTGGGIAYNREDLVEILERGPRPFARARSADRRERAGVEGVRAGGDARPRRQRASSSARSRTSTRWACTRATRSRWRRRRR